MNFISSKDAEEERVIHSKTDNVEFMSYDNVNDIVSRYQDNLQTSMRESDFIFDLVQLLYCKCHRINFRLGEPYIDSPG